MFSEIRQGSRTSFTFILYVCVRVNVIDISHSIQQFFSSIMYVYGLTDMHNRLLLLHFASASMVKVGVVGCEV